MFSCRGYSDDVVYFDDGTTKDEVGAYEQDVTFTVGDEEASPGANSAGCRVTMAYGDGGCWSATISLLEEDAPIPWPVRVRADGYTAIVEIDCPVGTKVSWRKAKGRDT